MAFPDASKLVYEIKHFGEITAGGGRVVPTVTSYFYRRNASASIPTKAALAAAFIASVSVQVSTVVSARWSAKRLEIRCINDADDPYVAFPDAVVGGVAGDSMDSTKCVFFLMRTSLRKSIRFGGRHIGPLAESQTTTPLSDVLNAGAVANAAALSAVFLANMVDAVPITWFPVIVSRKKPSVYNKNPTNVLTADITQILVNKRIAALKRRKIGSTY